MISIVLLWILNFVISIFNAWGCGKAWKETSDGFLSRLLLWCGAAMSASGFSWCYLTLLVGLSHGFGWLPTEYSVLAAEIGYVILIPIVIASGLVITVDSWIYFAKNRTLGGGLGAAYNTYATYRNISGAVEFFPTALSDIFRKLDTKDSNEDGKTKLLLLAAMLAIISLVGGILTTRYIILTTADNNTTN